jgi:hypothetical protein
MCVEYIYTGQFCNSRRQLVRFKYFMDLFTITSCSSSSLSMVSICRFLQRGETRRSSKVAIWVVVLKTRRNVFIAPKTLHFPCFAPFWNIPGNSWEYSREFLCLFVYELYVVYIYIYIYIYVRIYIYNSVTFVYFVVAENIPNNSREYSR